MTDKPTGVFVRLHDGKLTGEQLNKFQHFRNGGCEADTVMLAIGTPVTGGELEVVGYADPEDLPLSDGGPTNWTADINAKPDETCTVPLVRQSDAIAKLAEKDAGIARLQKIVGIFSAKIAEYASEGWDVPAPECVDLLDEAGVIEWDTFDPDVHDRAMFDGCDAGDPIWTLKGPEA